MLDQFLLSRAQVKEASVQEDRLIGELGLGHMSLEQLQKLAMMDGGGPPPGGPMPGVAGAPGAPPAPPAPPGMGPPAGAGGDGTSTTAAEDIGAAVGAAMKVIKDKEQQQAEAQAAAQQAEAEAQQAEAEAQAQAAQEQAMMEEQALAAQSPQPNLPPTFPPGQEPQAPPAGPPGAPPAGAPAAGGGPPPAGGPPGGMPPKQAFAYVMRKQATGAYVAKDIAGNIKSMRATADEGRSAQKKGLGIGAHMVAARRHQHRLRKQASQAIPALIAASTIGAAGLAGGSLIKQTKRMRAEGIARRQSATKKQAFAYMMKQAGLRQVGQSIHRGARGLGTHISELSSSGGRSARKIRRAGGSAKYRGQLAEGLRPAREAAIKGGKGSDAAKAYKEQSTAALQKYKSTVEKGKAYAANAPSAGRRAALGYGAVGAGAAGVGGGAYALQKNAEHGWVDRQAAKRYLPSDEGWGSSKKAFALAMRS